ncbi:hypothetical protein HRI_005275600 [Hibiscus trionum]|uniref:RRM domain-containing protein n=1 Tax=Hibiscus trionum TaxID=183268 RepID=A0A9W7JMT0_HIBTR|nr:hypothetical protein HRI_005275600 [Hibiscus trionum]
MAAIEAVAALSFPRLSSLTCQISISTPLFSQNFSISPLIRAQKNLGFKLYSTVQELSVESETEKIQKPNVKRKLFVLNLPRDYTDADIKHIFAQYGNVKDVEVIKEKDGKSRNFWFVTMASGEEAQAAVDSLNSHEVSGRIIKVEFARRFKRRSPASTQPMVPSPEPRHKLYVSNLNWKVRSSHLREIFSAFNPVSARVVFGTPSGQSAGYGFVSFATKEEAEAAFSALHGKELMDRPLRLKLSEKKADENTEQKEPGGEIREA